MDLKATKSEAGVPTSEHPEEDVLPPFEPQRYSRIENPVRQSPAAETPSPISIPSVRPVPNYLRSIIILAVLGLAGYGFAGYQSARDDARKIIGKIMSDNGMSADALQDVKIPFWAAFSDFDGKALFTFPADKTVIAGFSFQTVGEMGYVSFAGPEWVQVKMAAGLFP